MKALLTAGSICLLAFTGAVQAGPIMTQSYVEDGLEYYSSSVQPVADSFSLGSTAQVNEIVWWGTYFNSPLDVNEFNTFDPLDAFSLSLTNASGDLLSDLLLPAESALTVTYTGDTSDFFLPIYEYRLSVDISLDAGEYFLSIANDLASDDWGWLEGAGGDSLAFASDGFDPEWFELYDSDMAFALYAEVPEPAAWSLLLAGFLVAGKRKKMFG